jgi:acyl-CoA thioesterase FadM
MYVSCRLIMALWRSWRGPRVEPDAKITTKLTILPNDLDWNRHLNNGRYLTLMDIGRYDLVIRCGMGPLMRREKWWPVIASATIRFRRELKAFQKVDLTTQIIYWDDKWFYFEHTLVHDGSVYARAMVKGLFKSKTGNVPLVDVMKAMGVERTVPVKPPQISAWEEMDRGMR